jgi:hypothetical protein
MSRPRTHQDLSQQLRRRAKYLRAADRADRLVASVAIPALLILYAVSIFGSY